MEKEKIVVIVSGGMDSVTCLYAAVNQGYEVIGISFDYGSKHNNKELPLAQYHCNKLDIPHRVFYLNFKDFKSSLLEGQEEIPEGHYADENMKSTVVPFRNGIMLAYAVGVAESLGAKKVWLGSHKGDHAVYPDCSREFTDAINLASQLGTYEKVRIESPFNELMKWDIVKKGNELGIDYSKTWSCYKGKDKHCGKCGTCVERIEAFEKGGVKDLTEYE